MLIEIKLVSHKGLFQPVKKSKKSTTIGSKKKSTTPIGSKKSGKKSPSPIKNGGIPHNRPRLHNRHPSFIITNRYQTESNRMRSLLLVYGYCHLIEMEDLSAFFDIYYYKETQKNIFFNENENYSSNNSFNHFRIIPISIIELCHSFLYEKVNVDDFKQLSLIGKGGFAEVRLVTYKHSHDETKLYAMKSLSKKLMLKKNKKNKYL